MFDSFLTLNFLSNPVAEVEEEAAVEAEEYFDCLDVDHGKGKVDLEVPDDHDPNTAVNPPQKGVYWLYMPENFKFYLLALPLSAIEAPL